MGRPMGRHMGRPMAIPMGRPMGPPRRRPMGIPMGRPMGGTPMRRPRHGWAAAIAFSFLYVHAFPYYVRIWRIYVSRITYFTYHQKRRRIEYAHYVSVTYYARRYVFMRVGTAKRKAS